MPWRRARRWSVGDYEGWWMTLQRPQEAFPARVRRSRQRHLAPVIISRLGRSPGRALYVAGVGQHQMWASQFIGYENPRTWLNSGGLGTMGYRGAGRHGPRSRSSRSHGVGNRWRWLFQMTNQELATCTINDIPIKVALINNSSLGMVRRWQTLFCNEVFPHRPELHEFPDFVKLAEAYGCHGLRVNSPDGVDAGDRRQWT